MNTTDTIIIGEGFFGLFVGIKIAEKGYNVKIFEMNAKPLFITNLRLIFPEQYTYIKRFLSFSLIEKTITDVNFLYLFLKNLRNEASPFIFSKFLINQNLT